MSEAPRLASKSPPLAVPRHRKQLGSGAVGEISEGKQRHTDESSTAVMALVHPPHGA